MKLLITGNVPSQKNRKVISKKRDGTPFLRSHQSVVDWKNDAIQELTLQFRGYEITGYPIPLTLVFYFDNLRRHDLDNAAAGVLDALSAAGVIKDDSVAYVDCLTLQYGGLDKENPRVENYIED